VSATPNIPKKPYYRVNEVCQITDTQPYVLRFWESEFPQLQPERAAGGAPVYRENDVELIFRIKTLLYDEEYTIAGARQVLTKEGGKPAKKTTGKAKGRPVSKKLQQAAHPRQLELDSALPERPSRARAVESPPVEPGISRERYDDALEEISLLRLQLSEAENRLRRAEHDHERAVAETERLRDKRDRAIGRLEAILHRLA
jgi:DNA-binding transcriptional MerR regulator